MSSVVLGGLLLVFAVSDPLTLAAPEVVPMAATSLATGLVLLGLGLYLGRRTIPDRAVHATTAAVAGLVLGNAALHLLLAGQGRETTNLMLVVVGAGLVFYSAAWLLSVLAAAAAAWLAIAIARAGEVSPTSAWVHFGLAMVSSIALSGVVFSLRLQLLRGLLAEQRLLEIALARSRRNEEEFHRLADASFEGVGLHEGGVLLEHNRQLAEMFGRRDLVGTHIADVMAPGSRDFFLRATDAGPLRVYGVRTDGSVFPLEVRQRRVITNGCKLCVFALRDVTEFTLAEDRLRRAHDELEQRVGERTRALEDVNLALRHEVDERSRAEETLRAAKATAESEARTKSELMSIASHELRTPLTPLRLLLQATERHLQQGRPVDAGVIFRLERQATRLTDMVNDLLDSSRLELGTLVLRRRRLDLREVVAETVDDFRRQAPGRRIELELPPGPVVVDVDPARIAQVLANLVDNALKYSPAEATVEVRHRATATSTRVSVTDHGPGIPPAEQRRLFEAFYRAPGDAIRGKQGLGLGLYVARHIAELHGGRLWVESVVGRGSTFHLELRPASARQNHA